MITNILKKGLAAAAFLAVGSTAFADNVLSIKGFNIKPGATVDGIEINLKNDDQVSSFQFELELPEGITLVTSNQTGTIFYSGGRCKWYNPSISANPDANTNILRKDATHYLIICPNQYQYQLDGNNGTILYFAMKASNDFKVASNMKLKNFKATDRAGDKLETSLENGGVYANAYFAEDFNKTVEKIISDNNCPLVSPDNAAVSAVVDEVSKKVFNGEMTQAEANEIIKEAVIEEEVKSGDYDLDGEFVIDDVQKFLEDSFDEENGYDYNGDGEINIDDVQYLLEKLFEE